MHAFLYLFIYYRLFTGVILRKLNWAHFRREKKNFRVNSRNFRVNSRKLRVNLRKIIFFFSTKMSPIGFRRVELLLVFLYFLF